MTGSIFQDFATWLNSINGTSAKMRQNISGTYSLHCKINIPCGSVITPDFPVQETKFTLTMFDSSKKGENGRIAGIDNHEHQQLHQHFLSGGVSYISGNHTIGGVGSLAFMNLFSNVI